MSEESSTESLTTLVILILNILITLYLGGMKARSQLFSAKKQTDEELGELKLPKKANARLKKIHLNIEKLVEQAGLERASVT